MKKYNEIKNIQFKNLNGISEKNISIHYEKLYKGYVSKSQEINDKLINVNMETANASFSDIRELKVEESFVNNAVILHEAYFDILGGDGEIKGNIVELIKRDFKSIENWIENYKALGLCSRGWVLLAYDFNEGKLKNYILDSHNSLGIIGIAPVLVMDMYEHAYFIDFGSDKKSYIETFFKNINWEVVDIRLNKILNK